MAHDPTLDVAPSSPALWLGRTAEGKKPMPRTHDDGHATDRTGRVHLAVDDVRDFEKRHRNPSSRNRDLRKSAMPNMMQLRAPSDGVGVSMTEIRKAIERDGEAALWVGAAVVESPAQTSRSSVDPLRQSALPANSAPAKQITTMENADIDAMIVALAAVIRAYTRDAIRRQLVPSGGSPLAVFDEVQYPLDESSIWRGVPRAALIEAFLHDIVIALELDESSLVIALVLLERAMGANDDASFHLSCRTWRPSVLTAIVVASKIVYDEKVYLADYRDQLPQLCLDDAATQEVAFLNLLSFNTTVRRGQYAKYYYCLEDVARARWAAASPRCDGGDEGVDPA